MKIKVTATDSLRKIDEFNELGFIKLEEHDNEYPHVLGIADIRTIEDLIEIIDATHRSELCVYPEIILGKNMSTGEFYLEIYNGWRE